MATIIKKPKQETRDQLIRANASLDVQLSLARDQLAESRRKTEKLEATQTDLRGIIAELEREKAMLQGYIERQLQEERNKQVQVEWQTTPLGLNQLNRTEREPPFVMPALGEMPAGQIAHGKPWYKL